jgi:type I restriction enzyme S subunit
MITSFPIPDSWTGTTLGEILVRIEAGKSFRCEARPARDGEWGIIKVSAMTYGDFREKENKAITPGASFDVENEVRPGDILLSRANTQSYVGASVLVGECRPRLLLSDKSLRLVPSPSVDRRWLALLLSSPPIRREISLLATGTKDSMRNISQAALRDIRINVPPVAEQHRIAAALENYLFHLGSAIFSVQSVQRKQQLLTRRLVDAQIDALNATTHPLLSMLREPLINGRSVPTDSTGFPVLRLTALRDGRLALSERKTGRWTAADAAPFLVRKGDFFVSRGNGSLSLVGRGALLEDEPDLVAFPDTMRVIQGTG